jgi:hypothetical protein
LESAASEKFSALKKKDPSAKPEIEEDILLLELLRCVKYTGGSAAENVCPSFYFNSQTMG